jgi:hypothetical protein
VAGSGKTIILAQLIPHLVVKFQQKYGRDPLVLIYHHNTYARQLLRKEINAAMKQPMKLPPLPDRIANQRIFIHTLTTLINFLDNRDLFTKKPLSTEDRSKTAHSVRSSLRDLNGEFDIILVDEGQDLDADQYQLLIDLCRIDASTRERSLYIFYDELQNVFGQDGTVVERLKTQAIEHFLTQCIRTSKKTMDFIFNTCLGPSSPEATRNQLAEKLRLNQLKQQKLVHENSLDSKTLWLDCDFCTFPGEIYPQAERFTAEIACFQALEKEFSDLLYEQDIRDKLQGGILVLCPTFRRLTVNRKGGVP